eukprot:scaffold3909_cov117-Isochrysis_galbana.AAC.10
MRARCQLLRRSHVRQRVLTADWRIAAIVSIHVEVHLVGSDCLLQVRDEVVHHPDAVEEVLAAHRLLGAVWFDLLALHLVARAQAREETGMLADGRGDHAREQGALVGRDACELGRLGLFLIPEFLSPFILPHCLGLGVPVARRRAVVPSALK